MRAGHLSRKTGAVFGATVAAYALAAIPSLRAGQVRTAQSSASPQAQVVRLRPGVSAAGRAPVAPRTRAAAQTLTPSEKQRLVLPARLGSQPEAPIRLSASTTMIPNRARMALVSGNLYSGSDWGIYLRGPDGMLQLDARLDGSKAHLLDCMVLDDNASGGSVHLEAGGQSTAITLGAQPTHVTWVLVPETTDWYTVYLTATSPQPVALEVSYCEITPFK